jgi:hypothetical protein
VKEAEEKDRNLQNGLTAKAGVMLSCNHLDEIPLSDRTLRSITELGEVLQIIRKRMKLEGYEIIDGNISKPTT